MAGGTQLSVSTTSTSLDASSKRLVVAFAVAVVVTIGVIAHSFLSVLAPPKEAVESQPPVTASKTRVSSQPTWSSPPQNGSTVDPNNMFPTPSSNRNQTAAAVPPTNWGGMVRMQAEDLRKKVANSGEPEDAKRRSLKQIDEMEQKGLIIQ